MKKLFIVILTMASLNAFGQNNFPKGREKAVDYKYRISTPGITVPQFFTKSWDDRTNTQHIELHVKRNLDNKNIIGLKFATWRLFQPMGILWWDGLLDKVESETEFYPGHVRETGIGFSYQRMLWKGLFATVEVLPQFKTYLDEEGEKIGNGFKLYNSFHLGYHLAFGKKKRFFVEPQVHSQFWVFDTNTPDGFKQLDDQWKNYFLFEPNIYLGLKF
ncbi:hypothetical protein OU792_03400 [Algoriphagus sp. NF]|uniref:DUF3575 domain-containing protein n=1 Tax=Algoriphagus marincola TaxID=264027 RepID=A0ABS7N8E1_9BACT|nr:MULTISPECIES: hypothetical protein [Algoriphagus]MBY5952590.1 hypothetical protein [Algoriphagus marincola]MCR9081449.1 hypothetical protein [Cyclobacteriaceae bacterium]MDE0559015.1 hypothetical protein [Algoriphagus sp. NF]